MDKITTYKLGIFVQRVFVLPRVQMPQSLYCICLLLSIVDSGAIVICKIVNINLSNTLGIMYDLGILSRKK